MEQRPGYGYGAYGKGYGNHEGYGQKPISVLWSKTRVQLKRYFAITCRLGWLLPLTITSGVCLSAWIVSQMPPDFISQGTMMVSGQFEIKAGAAYNEQADNYYGTQILIMQSVAVRQAAMLRVQTQHPDLPAELITLKVSQEPHASVFNLSVEGRSPEYAQAYLDAIMDEYIEAKRKLRLRQSDSTTSAIQEELIRLDGEIAANDKLLREFQKANNIGFLQQEGNNAAIYLAQKNKEIADLKIEYNLLQMLDLDQNLDRQHGLTPSSSVPDDSNTKSENVSTSTAGPIADYQKAKQDLELLKGKRASMAERLRPAHPDMIAIDQQIQRENDLIKTLRSQSVDALKTRRDSIQIQIQNLESVIKEWETKALELSGRISEFETIKSKSDRSKEQYARLRTSQDNVTVTKNVDQDSIIIMQHASPGISIKPGWTKIILAGFGGGLLVGLAILFCIDQLDDRIGSFIELQTHFPETILGQIPHASFTEKEGLLHHNDERLALLESFRSLRSSLIFFPTEGARPKTLVVTSALPNEGKTTISANLAITLAFSGARTLVIDADMRRGRLSHIFGVEDGDGLSNILLGTKPWADVVHQTTVENLSLISCGPPLKHPAEHLLGKIADQFLREVYDKYDYVIFDSPPVTLLDDTLSLAPKVDGTLVVIRFGESAVRTSRRTLDLLIQRQTNVLGIICNDVQLAESEYNYGYYYRKTVDSYHKEMREVSKKDAPAKPVSGKDTKAPV